MSNPFQTLSDKLVEVQQSFKDKLEEAKSTDWNLRYLELKEYIVDLGAVPPRNEHTCG